jgi:ribonuclease E
MQQAAEMARAPSILHAEPDLVARTLRDYFNEEIDEVWIDTRDEYDAAVDYFQRVMPDYAERIKLYQDPIPIFAYYHVEEQIEATFERRVSLPSGGSIVVDQTEALVAIDVNSGKTTSEGSHEETVFKTNCEAAEEAARQLKLRDLGGIVVIDFIDMEQNEHKREVERVLAETAKLDKARYKISRINSKGICMLTRQRIRQGMRKAFQVRCPVCTGTGWVRTPESHSLSLVRRVETRLAQGGVGEVRITTHRSTAEYLLNHKRADLLRLEREYHCRVIVGARPDMDRSHDEVTYHSKGELLAEITDRLPPREEKPAKRKRKRSRKKSKSTSAAAESSASREGASSKKKKRKKRSGAKGNGDAAAAKTDEPPKSDKDDGGEDRPALAAKGSTTFTGRPSPEKLEQLKAERKARLARRPDMPSNAAAEHDQPSRPPEPAAPAAEAGEPTRRSILDRIFGSR